MNRWQLLRAVWLVGVAYVLPKAERGLRCTKPFCDFTCCTAEAGCTMGDFGGDVDIDANMVRMHAQCMHNACIFMKRACAVHAVARCSWAVGRGLDMPEVSVSRHSGFRHKTTTRRRSDGAEV